MTERRGKLSTAALLLGGLAVRWPAAVLGFVLLITGVLGSFALGVDQDDDVIRFLPQGDAEVERFQAIGRRFGGLSIAVVGIEVVDREGGDDLFTLERLGLVREIDEALRGLDGVNATTAFTELPDIVETTTDEGRSRADLHDLVGNLPPPGSPEAAAFLDDARQRTMSRAHVVGSLVSTDGAATIVLCQIDPDAPMKATADAIRDEVTRIVEAHDGAGVQPHFAGAPFVGSYAAENTRRDLIKLSPWVVAAVVLIMLLTSRSLSAVVIALFSVGAGIAQVMGGLGVLGRDLTLISSSLPVLLVALGSAYSVHLLAATLAELDRRGDGDRRAAVLAAVAEAGPPILIAGLTTAAGFVSFVVMDVDPMREFGVLMSLATVIIVVVTLLVVPAASVLLPMKPRAEGRAPRWALGAMRGAASAVARHRAIAIGALIAVAAVAGYGAMQVRAHTDIRTLFSEDSEPVRAEQFLSSRFGGSLFLQVELSGDIKSPAVLRQVDRIATVAAGLDDISRVESVTTAVNIASWATTGEPRVPPQRETTAALGTMVISNPAARLLVEDSWQHTLLQIQLAEFDITRARELAAELAAELEPLVGARVAVRRATMSQAARDAERAEIVAHLAAVLRAHGHGAAVDEARLEGALGADALGGLRKEVDQELRYNLVDDPMVTLADPASIDAVIDQVMERLSAGALDAEVFYRVLEPVVAASERKNPDSLREGTDFVFAAVRDIGQERIRAARVESVMSGLARDEPAALDTLEADVERALWSLGDPLAFVPADAVTAADEVVEEESGSIALTVSGYPLVYAAMNDSVERNQWGSLVTSAVLVLLALAWFYRSLVTAAIALVPAGFTLLVTFGIMGFLRIPMDVGTSMIAAIALGVGIDYAVHLLWRHGRPDEDRAEARLSEALSATGWGIVINALEVSVGLSLLVLGTIVPMRNFGLLTAAAMLVSAACTLIFVPALARRRAST